MSTDRSYTNRSTRIFESVRRNRTKRHWFGATLLIVLILTFLPLSSTSSPVQAGFDSDEAPAQEGVFYYEAWLGSTEENANTALIDYVATEVTIVGPRIGGNVCATLYIESDGIQLYKSEPQCQPFSAQIFPEKRTWYMYKPTNLGDRVRVRRGHNVIKVGYAAAYVGMHQDFDCGQDNPLVMCGDDWLYMSINAPAQTQTPTPMPTPSPNPTPITQPANGGIQVVNASSVEVNPGESFTPSVTVKVLSGQLDTEDYLGATSQGSSNTFGAHPTQGVTRVVKVGQTFTFDSHTTTQFQMTAPQQPGSYQSVWRMHIDGQDIGPNIVIPITVRSVSQPHPYDYWNADFYSSKDLSGSVAYHTTIPDLYLFKDWGNGSPAGNIPVDNWSGRFVREINFPGGEYRFHCQHDDGCRIYIDGQEKLNAWWDSSFDGHDWTGTLSAGLHEVKVEFYDQGGGAHVDVWWQGPGFLPRYPSCDAGQWCGDYWGNKTLAGTPTLTRYEGAANFLDVGWSFGSPGYNLPSDYFSARFSRSLLLECGTYRFHVTADDGDRFYIDGTLKLDEWTSKPQYTTDIDIQIPKGFHTFTVEYFENTGDTAARLSWDKIMSCAPYTGDLVISAGQTMFANTVQTSVTASGMTATVGSSEEFDLGDTVLFHQTQGTANAGKWEQAVISSMDGTTWTLDHTLTNTYSSTGGHAQVVKLPHYSSVTVQSGGTLTALPWNGTTGGILAFQSDGAVTVDGTITMTGKGYRGGNTPSSSGREGQQGEGYLAPGSNVWDNRPANTNGGGGGSRTSQSSVSTGGGGGGGYGSSGAGGWNINNSGLFGLGGTAIGTADLSTLFYGGGGGQGGNSNGYHGGNGGGAVLIFGNDITVNGSIVSNGATQGTNSVSNQDGNGGGGAGGAILIRSQTLTLGTNKVAATGGAGSGGTVGPSGDGGTGRVRIEYCTSLSGSTNPAASVQQTCATPTPTSTPTATPSNTSTATPTQAPTTVTFSPTDDTYAESATPSTALGSDPYLNIDASPQEVGYLKFNLASISGANVSSAKLRFYVANASGDTQQIHETSTSWSEGTLTWNNKPALDSAVVGTISTGGTANVWKEVDITASVQAHVGGLYAIGIDTAGGDGLGFPSSENSSNQVQLVVSYNGTSTPTPTSTPTATPTNTPTPTPGSGVELLTAPWNLSGSNGDDQAYEDVDPNVLAGKTMMRITYNLHGLTALGADASAIIFDQNGWQYISLSDYGQNGLNGSQTVTIPLTDFMDLDTASPVDGIHTRFWYGSSFTVDITSIVVY